MTVAESSSALRVLETSQAPAIYFPPADVRTELLKPNRRQTFCEWKGTAEYFDIEAGAGPRRRRGHTRTRTPGTSPSATTWPSTRSAWTSACSAKSAWSPTRATSTAAGSPATSRAVQGRARQPGLVVETLPLSWEGGALLVLDQRALPAQERWLRCEPPGCGRCDRSLAVRGAPAIGLAAAYGVALAPTGNERCARGGAGGFRGCRRAPGRHATDRREPALGARSPAGGARVRARRRRRPGGGAGPSARRRSRRRSRGANARLARIGRRAIRAAATARSRTATRVRWPPAAYGTAAGVLRPHGRTAGWRRCGCARPGPCSRAPGSPPGSWGGPGSRTGW